MSEGAQPHENGPRPTSPRTRDGWSVPDWAGVIGCVLALLAFFGYGTYQAFIGRQPPPPPEPATTAARPTVGPTYRQASEVGGTRWATTYKGVVVVLDFDDAGGVRLSDSPLGTYGHWQARDRNAIEIDTPDVTIAATLTTDRMGMSAAVYQPGTASQLAAVTLRRVR